jgi:hypothetical protein
MRFFSFIKMPWDLWVFLLVTSLGFLFSLEKVSEMNGGQKVVDFWRAPQAFATPEEASISYPHIEKIIESGMVLDLGCINRRGSKERAIGKEGVVRIKGKLCITSATRTTFKGINHISVKNLTNGYEGTIFIQDKLHAFVTDYLVLKEGKNPDVTLRKYAPGSTPSSLIPRTVAPLSKILSVNIGLILQQVTQKK